MNHRHFISPAVVITVSILAAAVFVGVNPSKPKTIAGEQSADEKAKQGKNSTDGFSPYVDDNGKISLPKGYKQKWAHLGGWAVAKKKGADVHEMHDVYTQPDTIAAFNVTGEFPDGAVLVKEVREAKSDGLTTGHAAWSADIKIWFVMIKDREGRFVDSDHWGDGWGWALFEAKDPTKNVSVGYDTSCLSCHTPVSDSDWVYVYGYPDLKTRKE
jgi:cytochrome c